MRTVEKIAASVRGVSTLKVVVGLGTEAHDKTSFGVSSQIPGNVCTVRVLRHLPVFEDIVTAHMFEGMLGDGLIY